MAPKDADRILQRTRWFARQPASLRQMLLADARISTVGAGQWIYGTGDALNGLYGVLDGSVHITTPLFGDDDMLLEIVQAGHLFGQAARFGGGPRLVTATAGEPTTLLHVPDHAMQQIARTHPEMWREFTELLYIQLARALRLAGAMIRLPPCKRVAARLFLLADDFDGPEPMHIAITQTQLAEMTGLSRKTVNAHLQTLAHAKIVTLDYGAIIIRNFAALRARTQ